MTIERAPLLLLVCLLLAASATPPRDQERSPRRVIIDQDTTGPGSTNTNAVALLLRAPGVIIEGITVATGDGWVGEEVSHVLRLLELMNRTDVPVISGSAGPLLPTSQKELDARATLNGAVGWRGAWQQSGNGDPYAINASHFPEGLPAIAAVPNTTPAEFIAHTLRRSPGEVAILALAPLTNIAAAMSIEPRLPQLARELVMMGGALACGHSEASHCDAGPPWHEFNMWFDAPAARKALRRADFVTGNWSSLTLVPADVASQPLWSTGAGRRPTALQRAVRRKLATSATARYIAKYTLASPTRVTFPLFDELTVLFWLACGVGSGGRRGRAMGAGAGASAVSSREAAAAAEATTVGAPAADAAAGAPLDRISREAEVASCDLIDGASSRLVDVSIAPSSYGMLRAWPLHAGVAPGLGEQLATVYTGRVDLDVMVQDLDALL